MTRSRKLILAAALLAGGYGLAVLLTGASGYFWPGHAPQVQPAPHGGAEAASAGAESRVGPAQLVPESAAADRYRSVDRYNAVDRYRSTDSPTAPDSQVAPPQSEPNPASLGYAGSREANADDGDRVAGLGDSTAPVDPLEADPAPAGAGPRAKLTDVKLRAAEELAPEASPWDRWPRWEPPVATASFKQAESPHDLTSSSAFGTSGQPITDAAPARATFDVSARDLARLRTHVVVDGDSLSKLADQYLDDPQLADAILELNRDVVTDPELLPIGAELKIPPRRQEDAPPARSQPSDRFGSPTTTSEETAPIDRTSPAQSEAPHAGILRRLPATTATHAPSP